MKRLFLFDFDGVCVKPGEITLDSLNWKANDVFTMMGFAPLSDDEWTHVFTEASGTTELNLIQKMCEMRNIPESGRVQFKEMFLLARRIHLETAHRKHDMKFGRNLHDLSYSDAVHFIRGLKNEPDTLIHLTTGNPRKSMGARLNLDPDWKTIFQNKGGSLPGAFGDEALSRQELIQLATRRAEESGFKVERDSEGYTTNVFYCGDTVHDLTAGIKAKTRTIFLTRDESKPYDMTPKLWLQQLLSNKTDIIGKEFDHATNIRPDGSLPGVLYATNFFNTSIASYIRPESWRDPEMTMKLQAQYESSIIKSFSRMMRV